MATATTTPATEDVVFISKSTNMLFSVSKGYELKNGHGDITAKVPDVMVTFQDFGGMGVLKTEEIRKQVAEQVPAEEIEANVAEAISAIRSSDHFNNPGFMGIWEEGRAPDEPRPSIAEQNERIAKAAAKRELEELHAVIADEAALHNRAVVIQNAQANIAALSDIE